MNLQLTDKRIIVTGGASGIGAAICETLFNEGAVPIVIDKNKSHFFTVETDLTDPSACRRAIEMIVKEYGGIDGIVNNAGYNDGVSLEHGTHEDFVRSINRNVSHYYILVQEALAHLKKSQGAVVNIISKVAETGQGGTSGYAAANGLRLEFTKAWAENLQKYHIRVSGVVVAECFTPGYADWIAKQPDAIQKLEQINASIPLENRTTTPQEIADTVVYLLSPAAPNGQIIYVDGGYVHLDRKINA